MTGLDIRSMTPADVDAVSVLYKSGGWDGRRSFLVRFLSNWACQSLVGLRDGADLRDAAHEPRPADRLGAGVDLEPARLRVRVIR